MTDVKMRVDSFDKFVYLFILGCSKTGLETHLERRFYDLDIHGAFSILVPQSAALQDDTIYISHLQTLARKILPSTWESGPAEVVVIQDSCPHGAFKVAKLSWLWLQSNMVHNTRDTNGMVNKIFFKEQKPGGHHESAGTCGHCANLPLFHVNGECDFSTMRGERTSL